MRVIRIANGFGMRAVAFDVKQNWLLTEVLGFRYVNLEELWNVSSRTGWQRGF